MKKESIDTIVELSKASISKQNDGKIGDAVKLAYVIGNFVKYAKEHKDEVKRSDFVLDKLLKRIAGEVDPSLKIRFVRLKKLVKKSNYLYVVYDGYKKLMDEKKNEHRKHRHKGHDSTTAREEGALSPDSPSSPDSPPPPPPPPPPPDPNHKPPKIPLTLPEDDSSPNTGEKGEAGGNESGETPNGQRSGSDEKLPKTSSTPPEGGSGPSREEKKEVKTAVSEAVRKESSEIPSGQQPEGSGEASSQPTTQGHTPGKLGGLGDIGPDVMSKLKKVPPPDPKKAQEGSQKPTGIAGDLASSPLFAKMHKKSEESEDKNKEN